MLLFNLLQQTTNLIINPGDIMIKLLVLFVLFFVTASSVAQERFLEISKKMDISTIQNRNKSLFDTIIFYGNTPMIFIYTDGKGYVFGVNGYGDLGKYQRIDNPFTGTLKEVTLYFFHKKIVGVADSFNVVVKEVSANGAPAELIYSLKASSNDIDTVQQYNIYLIPDIEVTGEFFVGFEWSSTFNDTIAVLCDSEGEGDMRKRPWEQWSDGQFKCVFETLNSCDIDMWAGAKISVSPVGIKENIPEVLLYKLGQNYPNPFNPSTVINFSLTSDAFVTLKVYNVIGQEVMTLVNGVMSAGVQTVNMNASNLETGVYMYSINVKGVDGSSFTSTKKMMLMK